MKRRTVMGESWPQRANRLEAELKAAQYWARRYYQKCQQAEALLTEARESGNNARRWSAAWKWWAKELWTEAHKQQTLKSFYAAQVEALTAETLRLRRLVEEMGGAPADVPPR